MTRSIERARQMLAEFEVRGFALRVRDGKLLVTPPGPIQTQDRTTIANNKADLIAAIDDREMDQAVLRLSEQGRFG